MMNMIIRFIFSICLWTPQRFWGLLKGKGWKHLKPSGVILRVSTAFHWCPHHSHYHLAITLFSFLNMYLCVCRCMRVQVFFHVQLINIIYPPEVVILNNLWANCNCSIKAYVQLRGHIQLNRNTINNQTHKHLYLSGISFRSYVCWTTHPKNMQFKVKMLQKKKY